MRKSGSCGRYGFLAFFALFTFHGVFGLSLVHAQNNNGNNGFPVAATILLPELDRWTAGGGALHIQRNANGFRLAVPENADWGNCYIEGDADLDAVAFLGLTVSEVDRDAKWLLTVNDPDAHSLESDGQSVGLHVWDLRRAPANFSGRKHFRIYLTVQGRGKHVDVRGVGLFDHAPVLSDPALPTIVVPHLSRMNNALPTQTADGRIDLALAPVAANKDQWGGLNTTVTVDTDRFPLVEATVDNLAPDARWRIALGNVASGPEHRNNATIALNYRDANHWEGTRDVDFQTIFTRYGGGAVGRPGPVRFVPYPSASADLVRKAARVFPRVPGTEKPLLRTGGFHLFWDTAAGLFRIQRDGSGSGSAALATRFLEMPGYDVTPATTTVLKPQRTKNGDTQITYARETKGIQFAVVLETKTSAPGLLHWRVTATPQAFPAHFASCGHEFVYRSSATDSTPNTMLKRIATQNLCASALAYVLAPDVGTVLYFQNLTPLNPLFEMTHMAPRWLVSAGNQTFGFANPLDNSIAFPPGKPVVVSDGYLYLAAEENEDSIERSALFLRSLAAVYAVLPDKPDTEWHDWQELARLSLRDLHSPAVWRGYEGKEYIQAYVGVHGATAHLAGLQDVLAPLQWFKETTGGEGDDLIRKMQSVVPTFWNPERGGLKEFAQPGDHVWYNVPFYVTLCRAALAGDTETGTLCLKSADALIRLAQDTHYTFEDKARGINTTTGSGREMVGTYLLYMMLCRELDPTQTRFLAEARRAAEQVATWGFGTTRETYWTAMTCEGLARLYEATKETSYLRISLIPLASLLRNAWLWECDYGDAKAYPTFWGINPDASGIDYIAPMEQHQAWYSLREYYLLCHDRLDPSARLLVSEFLRYAPQTIWYAYPAFLPATSLHQGPAFWNTDNDYRLYIPVEDLVDGWRKNGSVGQEVYGAGGVFSIASRAYTPVPEAGLLVFSEYPLLKCQWDPKANSLLLQVGGTNTFPCKVEVRPLIKAGKVMPCAWPDFGHVMARVAPHVTPQIAGKAIALSQTSIEGRAVVRTSVPGDSFLRLYNGTVVAPPPSR